MNNSNDPLSPSVLPARTSPPSTRSRAGSSAKEDPREHTEESNEFCLLVAGDHGGKSSFLRLLLETSTLAVTQDPEQRKQKSHMIKFIQGCATRTTAMRYMTLKVLVPSATSPRPTPKSSPKPEVQSVDVEKNLDNQVPLSLTLIDTPSINPLSAPISSSASTPDDVLRLVESRLAEAVESSSRIGLMHLCIYFLDPIHAYSLPRHHIDTICRLSARVNVLPVIGKADTLTNQQLRRMKEVVRSNLAEAGIGFGIFDQEPAANKGTEVEQQLNGKLEQKDSPGPTSKMPSLPYALISPDCYDILNPLPPSATSSPPLSGSPRNGPSPYPNQDTAPPGTPNLSSPSRFTRAYRWGFIDVLNPDHSDFLALQQAVFHHMHTLREYTKEYLLEKFKTDYLSAYRYPPYREHPSHSHHPRDIHISSSSSPYVHNLQHSYPPPHPSQQHHHSYSHSRSNSGSARPVLAIDTGNSDSTPRHRLVHEHTVSTSAPSRTTSSSRQPHHLPPSQPVPEPSSSSRSASKKEVAEGEKEKTRPKKITVACNFCRSRKLKCDGVRPSCVQCLKRSNACDYQTQGRRRGAKGKRDKVGASEKEAGKEKDKGEQETRPINTNGSSSGSARGSRRSKAGGSREESEDVDPDGDNGEGEGSRTGSQDAEGDEEDDGDVEMADPAGMSPRSPEVRRSRDGSLNEYPPPHLSQPPPYHRPSPGSSSNHFAHSHPTLPSISAEFPPPPTHTTRSRAPSISSITGPPDRDQREQRERGGYELPHIATLSLPDPTARPNRHSPHLSSSQHGHHTRSTSSSQHHLPPGAHLPPPHAHPQHTRSPPHHLPPPHLPSPHPHQSQQHHLSASSTPGSHISPHQSSSSAASSRLSPHHQHHRLPSPHQPPQHASQTQAHGTSRKRAATAPSKSSGPIDVGTGLPPPVPGPPRASEVSRGRSSTTSGLSEQGAPVTGGGNNAPPVESLGLGGSGVNVGTIGSVTASMIRTTGRLPNTSGPKIVACNFCRARKTKCDGAHPSCGSCARRNLPCNYVHERGGRRGGGAAAVAAAQAQAPSNTGAGVSTSGGGDKKPPSRGNKRISDADEEGSSGRKRMRVSDG